MKQKKKLTVTVIKNYAWNCKIEIIKDRDENMNDPSV